jgi:hypothetical protein
MAARLRFIAQNYTWTAIATVDQDSELERQSFLLGS